jgi:hypothetical protein
MEKGERRGEERERRERSVFSFPGVYVFLRSKR